MVAVVAMLIGCFRAWRKLSRSRASPHSAKNNTLAAWLQPILAGHGSILRELMFIVPHALGKLLVCLLLLASINRWSVSPLSPRFEGPSTQWLIARLGITDPQLNSISWVVAVCASYLAGTTIGALLGFVLVTVFGPLVSISLSTEGVWFGTLLLSWQQVTSVRFSKEHIELRLFYGGDPESDYLTLAPPTERLYEQTEVIVGHLLAARLALSGTVHQTRRRPLSGFLFVLAIVVALMGAFVLYPVKGEWVWFFYGVELIGLEFFGRVFFARRSPPIVTIM